jgi:hypothetical protein
MALKLTNGTDKNEGDIGGRLFGFEQRPRMYSCRRIRSRSCRVVKCRLIRNDVIVVYDRDNSFDAKRFVDRLTFRTTKLIVVRPN